MYGKKENSLVLIEKGQLTTYSLDNKVSWEIGRPSKENNPDIRLHSSTVSRKHGKFQNVDGIWFYLDYNGKNGTVYNHRHIDAGIHGRIKPILLKDGDVFVFGGGEEEVINHKTIWGLFVDKTFDGNWRTVDTRGYKQITFISEGKPLTVSDPQKGTVIEKETGIAIYMGDLTYMTGDMDMFGS